MTISDASHFSSSAKILDGRAVAGELRAELLRRTSALRSQGIRPCLAVVIVGADASSEAYTGALEREGTRCGVDVVRSALPASVAGAELRAELARLGVDDAVHGIILQQPLPPPLRAIDYVNRIPASKDVDGASALAQGLLAQRAPGAFAPATPSAVMLLLERSGAMPLAGKRIAVVGKSSVVGLPAALLLMHANATVTVTHKETNDLARHLRDAEIVVSATGVPGLITGVMIAPGAVIVDVGTTVIDGKIVGDVDFASVAGVASEVTPVPGGVGPVTNVALMRNVVAAAELATR